MLASQEAAGMYHYCCSNHDEFFWFQYVDSDTEIEDLTVEMSKVVSEQVRMCIHLRSFNIMKAQNVHLP